MTLKIEFEGTDGAGKTTGLQYFSEEAAKLGLTVISTQEVGNKHIPICMKLREIVLDPHSTLSGEAMEMIFAAMRFENDKWFDAMVEAGLDMVISDRGYFSHLAYGDHNCSVDFTKKFFENVVGPRTRLPNVVVYFDVSTETALSRRTKRGGLADVIEAKGVAFQEKVRGSFTSYLTTYEEAGMVTVYRVDANKSLEDVKQQLDRILQDLSYRGER
jgi:dTMP kinase